MKRVTWQEPSSRREEFESFKAQLQSKPGEWALWRPDVHHSYRYASRCSQIIKHGEHGWGPGWTSVIRGYWRTEKDRKTVHCGRIYVCWNGEHADAT